MWGALVGNISAIVKLDVGSSAALSERYKMLRSDRVYTLSAGFLD